MWKFTKEYVPNNTHGKINEFSRNNLEWQKQEKHIELFPIH